jgi:7,8-dihydropterin-6-yl-methyl-4-(beta-D-ribofuranosyl)aminobenzene 5'-phosphate synthase
LVNHCQLLPLPLRTIFIGLLTSSERVPHLKTHRTEQDHVRQVIRNQPGRNLLEIRNHLDQRTIFMKSCRYAIRRSLSGWLPCLSLVLSLAGGGLFSVVQAGDKGVVVQVVFDNVPKAPALRTAWGFAAVVEAPGHDILFDTGREGMLLLSNMQRMHLPIESIDTLFISHSHGDHTGGLAAVLEQNVALTLYLPASSLEKISRGLKPGVKTVGVSGPLQLAAGIYSTGELGDAIREQALVLDTQEGLVVMTGCAHPGIDAIANRVSALFERKIHMLIGGFHLGRSSEAEIRNIIERLKTLGVGKVAPSHCTGKQAMRLFREAWGENFIESGAGAVIRLPPLRMDQ